MYSRAAVLILVATLIGSAPTDFVKLPLGSTDCGAYKSTIAVCMGICSSPVLECTTE